MPSPQSLLSRAKALASASKSILPIALASSSPAASLNFDYFGTAMFDNSGFFVSTLSTPANGGGITQGTGFKLWGSDSIHDSAFYRFDESRQETLAISDGDGLGMLWGGSINGSLQAGDVISAPYEFDYSFTQTPGFAGDDYVSNPWRISIGLIDRTDDPINWSQDAAYGQLSPITTAAENGYESVDGEFHRTGTISLTVEDWMLQSYSPTHWFVQLEVLVEHENNFFAYNGPFPKLNGDILEVNVPQNSIDISYTPVPEPSGLLIALTGGLFMMRRRRNA
ncbi:PEP-CTERM sorting domain-containing protein [Haloferula chungangensis]|uniref:PEP-CTERM sorting domain-containing protein n=1 Tax=Haloferula chungangensis TaxID=1048331 RepID=A0ABW2L6S1_9BACT